MSRRILFAGLLLLFAAWQGDRASAEHDDFRFKWPYAPGASISVTTYPYNGVHGCGGGSCTDAWDIVIGDNGVRASAEGAIAFVVSNINPNTCNPDDGNGYGNHVMVYVPTADVTLLYGHLASTPYSPQDVGDRILQGDSVGVQGYTGHTEGTTPYPCGTHLHFEFRPSVPSDPVHPDEIDGAPNPGASTNSVIGAFNLPGAAVRQYYWDLGELGFGPSWGIAGWTSDKTGSGAGCGSNPYCRLYIHYSPNPLEGHRGSKIDLRQHPDAGGYDYNGIMVGRWAVNDAYWVKKGFFESWWDGPARVGLPIAEELGTTQFLPLCPASLNCERYQRFHVGYIWEEEVVGVRPAVFCPSIAPPYPNVDYVVDLGNDITTEINHYGAGDQGLQPYEAWPDSWYDINGDGLVDLANDIVSVINAYGMYCYPP